jgi:hypothetical protein
MKRLVHKACHRVKAAQGISSNKKHVFDKTPGAVYQSKEDLANQYVEKGSLAMSEIRDLIPEVERVSRHKSSLFSVRDVERKTLNIAVAMRIKCLKLSCIMKISVPQTR